MRILGPVVQSFVPPMLDRGHHLVFRGAVARQLVRDHHTRHAGLPLQQLAKQALGGLFVPPALDENVEHEAVLVDRPPEPVLLAADHQAHFIEVPLVSRVWQLAADLVGEALAELARPLAHGFMAHVDAAGGQHLFHHAQAQRKAEVEPNGVADDLAGKALVGVGGLGCGCHAGPLPVPTLSAKSRPKLTVPARSSAPIGSIGSSWFSRWRSTGRSRPDCGTPSKTEPPPKKNRGGAAQEHRPQLDVAVQAWPAAYPVLPSAPHRSTTPLGGLEK